MRSRDPFNPFVWIYRLTCAALRDGMEFTGVSLQWWRRVIPVFALSLILLVPAAYFGKLRDELVRARWCGVSVSSINSNNDDPRDDDATISKKCAWMYLHDGLVVYLTVMILFHFLRTMFLSPGFSASDHHLTTMADADKIDFATEMERTELFYGSSSSVRSTSKQDTMTKCSYFPDPHPSFCKKCNSDRPPRCHHCSICGRCVLQFDHHCLWLNNCIGYNNHRSFILSLVFITAGCWYGVVVMYKPFYEPLQEQLREYGGLLNYMKQYAAANNELIKDRNSLFAIPTVAEMSDMMLCPDKSIPVQAVVDIVFPLLFGVGGILALFLGMHVKYILAARTTLEHRILLDGQYKSLLSKLVKKKETATNATTQPTNNPYDQGYYRNWVQAMGSNWLYLLLPLPLTPLPPYVPELAIKKEK